MSSLIGELAVIWTIVLVIFLPILAFYIIVFWKLFEKAGEPGWKSIIPLYSSYVLFKFTWGNGWFFLLYTITRLGNSIISAIVKNDYSNSAGLSLLWFFVWAGYIIVRIFYSIKLAKAFGKDGGWACGIFFLGFIFIPIMAFSKDIVYVGVPGKTTTYGNGYGQQNYQQPGYQSPYLDPYTQQNNYQQQSAQNSQYYYQQPTAQSALKYCSSCGSQIDTNGKFCPKCGKPQ